MPAPSTPDPARRDAPEWFLRRPLFWWAAAAGAGIYAGFHLSLPPVAWLLATAAGALAALAGMRTAGVTLALAALAAGWTAQHTRAPEDPYLHDAAAVTLRGVLLRAGPGGSALLRAESRLTAGGWAPCEARIGLHGAGPARAGDRVEASGILRRPEPPTNPGGRDRRLQWLERGAFYVLEVRPLGFSVLAHGARGPLEAWAATARERVLTTNRATLSPTAAIIANEFLIGDEAPPD
ncbi:MAG TPA: DUF4131 domain-containing protein, partial [Armatimonadota bacterium]|nr:DUF4131 domain-containing protein [Armatimonadota bacterium]